MQQDTTNNRVIVDFYFYADKLEFTAIDQLMEIEATEKRIKESFKIQEFAKDYWILSTDYEPSEDINVQLNKIYDIISNKIKTIKDICEYYNALCGFCIVVERHDDIMPAIYYERDFVKFVAEINAEINMDFT